MLLFIFFFNEKDHYVCVLTSYLILFCGRRQLCLSFVFCENLNEMKNSKDRHIERGDLFFL